MSDYEFNPFYEYELRVDGLPEAIESAMKEARKQAKKNGGKILILKVIAGRGRAVYVVTCRDFSDSRRFDVLHRDWLESYLSEFTKRR